jgi:TolB protein
MKVLTVIAMVLALTVLAPAKMGAAPAGAEVNNGFIALTLKDSADYLQIFTIRPDGTSQRQLTFEGHNGRPAWSRDGRKIVYSSRRGTQFLVNVMEADGSHQKALCEGEAPDWSPDGKKIAFSRDWQIWLVDADGANQRQLTSSATAKKGPTWSPDGRQLAFIVVRNPTSPHDPQPRIGIMKSDGTDERLLTREPRMNIRVNPDGTKTVLETAADANAPSWSPVSDEIAFWSGTENQYGQIWRIRADGTGSRQLTDDPSRRNNDDPSWSPDGQNIIFGTGRSGRPELWIIDRDGRNPRRLFHKLDAGPFPGRASWQPMANNASLAPRP